MAQLLLLVLVVGLASQWLAWRIKLPAIVILIASGLILGPVTGVMQPASSPQELNGLIGLGVAIILFEGGMELKLGELRRTGAGVWRLALLGPPLAWLLGALAAHYVGGLGWPVAIVMAAILVVTGPTVILPLLRQARLDKDTASLLKWEAIANDPTGVLLAVMSFQYFVHAGGPLGESLRNLGLALAVGAGIGSASGWVVGWLYRRGAVSPHLKAPILTVLVLVVYWLTNQVRDEAGLLAVVAMGIVIANMKLVERQALLSFKEDLSTVQLSVLFIVIPVQLAPAQLMQIDARTVLFVLVLMFAVRPLSVLLATAGAPIRRNDKLLLAWIAPRGIVATATAAVFGPALEQAGHADAGKLLPIVFLVIFATVLAHGLTLRPLARRLKLAAGESNGLLIVGATDFALALAQALRRLEVEVMIVDGSFSQLKAARMAGVPVHYGEILSEHSAQQLDVQHLSHLLCVLDNDFYNALVCKARAPAFGHHRTFQIAADQASAPAFKRLSIDQRGYYAFAREARFDVLAEHVAAGWSIQSTKISKSHGWSELNDRLDAASPDWLLLGGITPKGQFRIYSPEQRFKLEPDWTAIYFAPNDRTPTSPKAAADAATIAARDAARAGFTPSAPAAAQSAPR